MPQSRTTKTITALVIAMTVGTFLLIALETEPIMPPSPALTAEGEGPVATAVADTAVPLDTERWRHIVLHSPAEGEDIAQRCHFVVRGSQVTASDAWRSQQPRRHVRQLVRGHDYSSDSIGICVMTDFFRAGPSEAEFEAAVRLVTTLQQACGIDRARVLLPRDLNGSLPAANRFFARHLTERLLRVDE